MILEIEYYKGDTLLLGKAENAAELQEQLSKTEAMYDKENDNFTELFCRMYGWSVTDSKVLPDYIYDRDTKRLYKPIHR